MRMSCNGCRVLRKGCSESCSIRPCLQWIKNPESQANATVFLAKFYGRAGLMNLINAGPDHLRPAIFRSLLYEACGRIVNPIYGSVGLLWSGNWQLCQTAVDGVLNGAPILQISSEMAANNPVPPLHKAMMSSYDIRHIAKDDPAAPHPPAVASVATSSSAHDLHKVNKASHNRFKRSVSHASGVPGGPARPESRPGSLEPAEPAPGGAPSSDVCEDLHWRRCYAVEMAQRAGSHESSLSQASEPNSAGGAGVAGGAGMMTPGGSDSRENESEASMVTSHGADLGKANGLASEDSDVELDLTLGLEPVHHSQSPHSSSASHSRGQSPSRRALRPTGAEMPYRCDRMTVDGWAVRETTRIDLGLDLPA